MSFFDWIKRNLSPIAPYEPVIPVPPPPPPPIPPEVANRRAEAMRRRAEDGLIYKKAVQDAMATDFLPPPVPSVDWYENHPDYKWNPHEPNPERPPKPLPPRPEPKPNPQPTPDKVDIWIQAQDRWKSDWDRYRELSQNRRNRPKSQPPSISFYSDHPLYKWEPWKEQVR